jgi:hypothetical protein
VLAPLAVSVVVLVVLGLFLPAALAQLLGRIAEAFTI